VTHDQEEALTMSDRIAVMNHGRIQQLGGPTELYERPVNLFVSNFIGVSNPMPGRVVELGGDHSAVVETDRGLRLRGRITDRDARPAVGAVVTVATRPERLSVLPASAPGSAAPGEVDIQGRIKQGTYLGDQTEYRVTTDLAGELIVRRQNAAGVGSGEGVGPGDPVVVRWQEEANLILVG
jgi:ABC-type Fe3+/spermidine/putrescine transport system ATPase subunit